MPVFRNVYNALFQVKFKEITLSHGHCFTAVNCLFRHDDLLSLDGHLDGAVVPHIGLLAGEVGLRLARILLQVLCVRFGLNHSALL